MFRMPRSKRDAEDNKDVSEEDDYYYDDDEDE